ncbi:MAG: aminoglycoside phosphotransferase (APT) family kinase protein [Candidatus Azotimanducaceae bacterium]|jgi:aminoglycoside phosphotransferase (APT) family kinase protein
MNTKTHNYLETVVGVLRNVASSPQIQKEQKDDLIAASRLVDCLLIEVSIGMVASKEYFSAVSKLLPEIKLAIEHLGSAGVESIGSHLARLNEFDADSTLTSLDTFQKYVAELQSDLCQIKTLEITRLTMALLKADSDLSRALFSAGLSAAGKVEANSSGAANQKNFDEQALLAYIKDQFPGNAKAEIKNSGFISGGQSKFTLGIELSGVSTIANSVILRGDGSSAFSGASVADEYRLQKLLFQKGVCVPEPLVLEDVGTVFGSPFMLSNKAQGSSIGHMYMLPEPDEKVLIDIAKNIAKIHIIPAETFGDWIDNANNSTSEKVLSWIDIARRDMAALDVRSATFEKAFAWLKSNAGLNDNAPRVLVHGDYGLNNLLIENSEVMAVLDWEFSHIGNPAYDLAYFYFQAEALSSWECFIEAYANAGATLPDENQLNYNLILSIARLGVQCAQVTSAFNAGLVTGASAGRVVSNQYFNESVLRLSDALYRVL